MKISLIHKLVFGIFMVSAVTYSTSAFFIFVLKPYLAPNMKDWLYSSGVLALGLLWSCFLGWLAALYIIRPLKRLTLTANEVANGNLAVAMPEHRSSDEIGQLHLSFHTMLTNLRQMISDVSNSVAITEQSADTLGSAIVQAAEQIETISITIEQMADGATQQAGASEQMLASAEMSSSTAELMNQEAGEASQTAKVMIHTITESMSQVNTLVDGMVEISHLSEQTMAIVEQLQLQASEIGQISQLVGEIADQTHLLALNASIEAAHAGEQGHGFAVVAHHIRKLAADCASANGQIQQLVELMQQQTNTVATETDRQVKLIREETTAGEQTRKYLEEVTVAADQTATALQHIVEHITSSVSQAHQSFTMSKAMASTAEEISSGAIRISSAAQEQTAVMEEIAASSEMLRAEAHELKNKTTVFRT